MGFFLKLCKGSKGFILRITEVLEASGKDTPGADVHVRRLHKAEARPEFQNKLRAAANIWLEVMGQCGPKS